MGWAVLHSLHAFGHRGLVMAWYDENRMVVEGQRIQEERYTSEAYNDHVAYVEWDGTVVYEDGYGVDDDGEVVYFCDIYECKYCPRYGDDCDGRE